jgi:4-hydroxyphenylpyruvate dioxygenase
MRTVRGVSWSCFGLLVVLEQGIALSSPTKGAWKPKMSSLEERRKLRGVKHESETIGSLGFHHIEFYCGDAKSTANQFASSLGMAVVGTTGQSTGNDKCVSYGLASGNFQLLLTAPYSRAVVAEGVAGGGGDQVQYDAPDPMPSFDLEFAHEFFQKHGLAARAVGVLVKDAKAAFEVSVKNGATPVMEPSFVPTCQGQVKKGVKSTGCHMSEVKLYGDVVMRYISYPDQASTNEEEEGAVTTTSKVPFLPHLAPTEGKMAERESYGIFKIDHAVGNVPNLREAHEHIKQFTGFHEFAEFTTEDVGTVESGLNSVVLASDSEDVLLPINEPTMGKRKSQILTYLEQNEGAGLQHLALKSTDIFATVKRMREVEENSFGFELMKRPSDEYYRGLSDRLGDQLTVRSIYCTDGDLVPDTHNVLTLVGLQESQYEKLEELGILADADDEGILLQLFTKPIGDRPTFFFEIIQRIGCRYRSDDSDEELERPGCGGFGQGNFRELFKSIEVSLHLSTSLLTVFSLAFLF